MGEGSDETPKEVSYMHYDEPPTDSHKHVETNIN